MDQSQFFKYHNHNHILKESTAFLGEIDGIGPSQFFVFL